MPFSVHISPAARRDLKKLRGSVLRRVAAAIDCLAENPRPQGSRKLSGAQDLCRVRVGDYRIVYRIEDDQLVVLVVRVAPWKDAY